MEKLIQNMDNSSKLHLQRYTENLHFWKVSKNHAEFKLEDKSSLNQLIKTFVMEFKNLKRGNDDLVRKLNIQFMDSIKAFFRNLKVGFEDFNEYAQSQHNKFHSERIEFVRQTALAILEASQKKYHFTPLLSRFIGKDVTLEERTDVYLTEAIMMDVFNYEKICSLFFSKYTDFITGFSMDREDVIKDIIRIQMKAFENNELDLLYNIEKELKETLVQTINRVKPCQAVLSMKELPQNTNSPTSWDIATQFELNDEDIDLKQVLCIGQNHVLATLSLRASNMLICVFSKDLISSLCSTTINDHNTEFASGSTIDNLIYFCNTNQKACICYEHENRLIEKKVLNFYSQMTKTVKFPALINPKEIAFLNEENQFRLASLDTKGENTDANEVIMKSYSSLVLSPCRNFLVLVGDSDLFVFNTKLEMILIEYSAPQFCMFADKVLTCVYVNEQNEVFVKSVKYPFDVETSQQGAQLASRISSHYERTLQFGKGMLSDMFSENKFTSNTRK